MYSGTEKEKHAEHILKVWQYAVERLKYNPFQKDLETFTHIVASNNSIDQEEIQIQEDFENNN